MTDVKLSVTIELQGSTMMTPQECGENPENYNNNFIMLDVKHYDKNTRKKFYKKEPLHFKTRKCIPAYQSISMSPEAYSYMTSTSCPDWFIPSGGTGLWKRLSNTKRLEAHLERICKSFGGKSYTYVVFED